MFIKCYNLEHKCHYFWTHNFNNGHSCHHTNFKSNFFLWIFYSYFNLGSIQIWSQILTWVLYTDHFLSLYNFQVTFLTWFQYAAICGQMSQNVTKNVTEILTNVTCNLTKMLHVIVPKCHITFVCNVSNCCSNITN